MFDVATALARHRDANDALSGVHKKGRPKAAFADATAALWQLRDQKL